jgi:hypothetical protein
MPSRTTTTTTAKDANAPKKPLTAYMLFSAVERPKLKASGLDNFAEMSKALGAAWKKVDDKTKVKKFVKIFFVFILIYFRLIMRKNMNEKKHDMKTN